MHKVLIVVDMQNDFVTGSLGSETAQAIIPNVEKKILEYLKSEREDEVYFTRDSHATDYLSTKEGEKLPVEHCIYGSHGWQIIPELKQYSELADEIVNKDSFGYPCWEDELGREERIESIELIGVCTDICVVSNALILKALYPEVEIIVDASCCAGTTPEAHQAALRVMQSCQITVIGEEFYVEMGKHNR